LSIFNLLQVIANKLKQSSYLWHLGLLNIKMFMTRCSI